MGTTGIQLQNFPLYSFFGILLDFWPFRNALQKWLRKNIEKNAIEDFGFPKPPQKPSKTPPKSMSQQTCDFSAIFARKNHCCKSADIDFVSVFPILFACWALFFQSLLACIFGPKNQPKTLPKRRPNPLKIDAKSVLFFNIDFLRFRRRFWRLLGLQLAAKLGRKLFKNLGICPCEPSQVRHL